MISTSVLHIFGMLIGEVASMQKWLWRGLRFTGGAVTASGVAFLLQSLTGTAETTNSALLGLVDPRAGWCV